MEAGANGGHMYLTPMALELELEVGLVNALHNQGLDHYAWEMARKLWIVGQVRLAANNLHQCRKMSMF